MSNRLVINHEGTHGFFSYCSVALIQIVKYIIDNKFGPDDIDMSKIFTTFKKIDNDDISKIFFKINPMIKINIDSELDNFTKDNQFINYNFINYTVILPIINKYFNLSDEIINIVNTIEKKYKINYNNTCCIFYRGTDKSTETNIPTYEDVYNIVNLKYKNMNYLLQSDEIEFFTYFTEKLSNCIIFKDEIKTISKKSKGSINHNINDASTRLLYIKNFLAIVLIMSKCKYIVCNAGNISLWISYFRGNSNNMSIFLNDKFLDFEKNIILNINSEIIIDTMKKTRFFEINKDIYPNNFFGDGEHYSLFVTIANQLYNKKIIEIGTNQGHSALAFSFNSIENKNKIYTYDINNNLIKNISNKSTFNFSTENLLDIKYRNKIEIKEHILSADIIFIDIDPHTGILEFKMYEWLKNNNFTGIIIFDDIYMGKKGHSYEHRAEDGHFMYINLWKKIPESEKICISHLGHASGTGIVNFNFNNKINVGF